MATKRKAGMTFAELKTALDGATPEQLAQPVRWWGDERGGEITSLEQISEEMGLTSEGYEPKSSFESEEEYKECDSFIPVGTIVLYTDESE